MKGLGGWLLASGAGAALGAGLLVLSRGRFDAGAVLAGFVTAATCTAVAGLGERLAARRAVQRRMGCAVGGHLLSLALGIGAMVLCVRSQPEAKCVPFGTALTGFYLAFLTRRVTLLNLAFFREGIGGKR